MAELLGWDQARETEEIADYLSVVKRSREFLAGVPRASKAR